VVIAIAILAAVAPSIFGSGSTDNAAARQPTRAELRDLSAAASSEQAYRARHRGRRVVVPNIAGDHYWDALHRLHRHGLRLQGRFPGTLGNPALPGHCIIISTQSPAAGEHLPRGSAVTGVMGLCKASIPRLARNHGDWDR
jgi:hypothetical protein